MDDRDDFERQRLEWKRGQRKLRRIQDLGLLLLALGVLVLPYAVLVLNVR